MKRLCKHQIWEMLLENINLNPKIKVIELNGKTNSSPTEMNGHLKVLSDNCLIIINPDMRNRTRKWSYKITKAGLNYLSMLKIINIFDGSEMGKRKWQKK
jgi:hypothetical protein